MEMSSEALLMMASREGNTREDRGRSHWLVVLPTSSQSTGQAVTHGLKPSGEGVILPFLQLSLSEQLLSATRRDLPCFHLPQTLCIAVTGPKSPVLRKAKTQNVCPLIGLFLPGQAEMRP